MVCCLHCMFEDTNRQGWCVHCIHKVSYFITMFFKKNQLVVNSGKLRFKKKFAPADGRWCPPVFALDFTPFRHTFDVVRHAMSYVSLLSATHFSDHDLWTVEVTSTCLEWKLGRHYSHGSSDCTQLQSTPSQAATPQIPSCGVHSGSPTPRDTTT